MKRHWLATGLLLSIILAGNCWAKYQENPDAVFKALHADDSTINQAVIDELKLDLMADGYYAEGLRWERDVPGKTKVLAMDVHSDTNYLFWRREGKGWKYLGSYLYEMQIQNHPFLKTITAPDNRSFLRIIYYQDEGTGIYRQGEDWFDLSGDTAINILTFPTNGDCCPSCLCSEINFHCSSLQNIKGDLHLKISYKGVYSNLGFWNEEFPRIKELFRAKRDIYYVLPKGKTSFVVDTTMSKWSQQDIYNMFTMGASDIWTTFHDELSELKKKNDPEINRMLDKLESCAKKELESNGPYLYY
jgi:hypothetical protein